MRGFFVYRFLDKYNNIIYVGRTKNLKSRIACHFSNTSINDEYCKMRKGCINKVETIEYIELDSEFDMVLYEIYYISKYKPEYNILDLYDMKPSSKIKFPNLEWKYYDKNKDADNIVIKLYNSTTGVEIVSIRSNKKDYDDIKDKFNLNTKYEDIKYSNSIIENNIKILKTLNRNFRKISNARHERIKTKSLELSGNHMSKEDYIFIISTIKNGFVKDNISLKPNIRIATILETMANTGIGIGTVLNLKLEMIHKIDDKYILNYNTSTFIINDKVYNYLNEYSVKNKIKPSCKLFDIRGRIVQQQLKTTCDAFGIRNVTPDSFRKYFATQIYVNNNYNIQLVSQLLQHSSVVTTQRYIGIQQKDIEDALNKHIYLL